MNGVLVGILRVRMRMGWGGYSHRPDRWPRALSSGESSLEPSVNSFCVYRMGGIGPSQFLLDQPTQSVLCSSRLISWLINPNPGLLSQFSLKYNTVPEGPCVFHLSPFICLALCLPFSLFSLSFTISGSMRHGSTWLVVQKWHNDSPRALGVPCSQWVSCDDDDGHSYI